MYHVTSETELFKKSLVQPGKPIYTVSITAALFYETLWYSTKLGVTECSGWESRVQDVYTVYKHCTKWPQNLCCF